MFFLGHDFANSHMAGPLVPTRALSAMHWAFLLDDFSYMLYYKQPINEESSAKSSVLFSSMLYLYIIMIKNALMMVFTD